MTAKELLFYLQPSPQGEKSEFLPQANAEPENTNGAPLGDENVEKSDIYCPHCHSRARKNGHTKKGTQRYFCPKCRKSFNQFTGTILERTSKPLSVWESFITCMLERRTVREAASICGISRNTSFLWRHKILDSLQSMMDAVKMDGVIEADEAFFRLSYKGNHSNDNFTMPREAHKRGVDAYRNGASDEQVCVPTAVTRQGLSVGKIGCLGTASKKAVERVLAGHILEQSTICTDSLKNYSYLEPLFKVKNVAVEAGKGMAHGLGMQCVNAYHACFKAMVDGHFRGVATKYLNNYIVWYNFAVHARETFEEKIVILLNFIKENICESRCLQIPKRNPVPVLV